MSVSETLEKHGDAVRTLAGLTEKMSLDDMTTVLSKIMRISINLGGHAADLDDIDDGTSPSLQFIAQDAKTFSGYVTTANSHVPVDGRKWLVFSTGKKEIRKWQLALSDNPVELYSRCWIDGHWTDWQKLGGGVAKALLCAMLPERGCAA